jgi:hypothetical protein
VALPLEIKAKRGHITAGDRSIGVAVTNSLGGLRLLGVNPDGSFYVIAEEVVLSETIQVDQTVRHYDATGKLLGLARVPLAEQYTYVEHGLVVGPDGAVYVLITWPDRVEVQRLRFSKELKPILPTASAETSAQNGEAKAVAPLQGCRSRDSMMSVASEYVNNWKYLNSSNTDGACSGRCKPRYITVPNAYYASVAYDWGGWDTVSAYNSFMHPNSYQAGDAPRTGCAATVEGCSKGTDCSGFVSRCWGLSSKQSTCTLRDISGQLTSILVLLPGDIVDKCGVHVVLFASYSGNGLYAYESTTLSAYDRVVYTYSPYSRFSGYEPRRYYNVCP